MKALYVASAEETGIFSTMCGLGFCESKNKDNNIRYLIGLDGHIIPMCETCFTNDNNQRAKEWYKHRYRLMSEEEILIKRVLDR